MSTTIKVLMTEIKYDVYLIEVRFLDARVLEAFLAWAHRSLDKLLNHALKLSLSQLHEQNR